MNISTKYLSHLVWGISIIFLVMSPGCAGVAMVATVASGINVVEGSKISPETIEQYKKMQEESPELQRLREQAKKDPQGRVAAGLKCAGRLEGEGSGEKIAAQEEKEDCYWRSPLSALFNPFGAQDALTGSLRSALLNLSKSQIIMAKALGLDEQVILAEQNVKNMESGDMGTSAEVKKSIEISTSVQEEITKEAAKKTILDAKSKAVFVTSIPFYTSGVLGSVQTGHQAYQAGQSMRSLNPAALLQVGALVTIVNNLPDLISKLSSSTGQIIDFMTVNEIDNSEMKDKLADAF